MTDYSTTRAEVQDRIAAISSDPNVTSNTDLLKLAKVGVDVGADLTALETEVQARLDAVGVNTTLTDILKLVKSVPAPTAARNTLNADPSAMHWMYVGNYTSPSSFYLLPTTASVAEASGTLSNYKSTNGVAVVDIVGAGYVTGLTTPRLHSAAATNSNLAWRWFITVDGVEHLVDWAFDTTGNNMDHNQAAGGALVENWNSCGVFKIARLDDPAGAKIGVSSTVIPSLSTDLRNSRELGFIFDEGLCFRFNSSLSVALKLTNSSGDTLNSDTTSVFYELD